MLWWALAFQLAGCGASQRGARAAGEAGAAPPALYERIPTGPQPVLLARPAELFQHQGFELMWRAVMDGPQPPTFERALGAPLKQIAQLAVVRVDEHGYLALAQGAFDADERVRAVGDRLEPIDVRVDAPLVRREGLSGKRRYAYAALASDVVAVAREVAPALFAQVLARHDRGSTPHPLATEDARQLHTQHRASPCLLIVPEPLALPPGSQAALLLARQRALAVSLEPHGPALTLRITLLGTFPPDAAEHFRRLVFALGSSGLGRLFGLAEPSRQAQVHAAGEQVHVSLEVSGAEVAKGLRAVFYDELPTLFD